jgi:hypothetical protein
MDAPINGNRHGPARYPIDSNRKPENADAAGLTRRMQRSRWTGLDKD